MNDYYCGCGQLVMTSVTKSNTPMAYLTQRVVDWLCTDIIRNEKRTENEKDEENVW
jgi:hypothetical protein